MKMYQSMYQSVKINGVNILTSMFERYRNETWVMSGSEIKMKAGGFFSGKWGAFRNQKAEHLFGLKSGVVLDLSPQLAGTRLHFLKSHEHSGFCSLNNLSSINGTFHIVDSTTIKVKGLPRFEFKLLEAEVDFLEEFLHSCFNQAKENHGVAEAQAQEQKRQKAAQKFEKERHLVKSRATALREFDQDGNGVIDVLESGDDFMRLFKKHQKKVIELDKQYVHAFVKISNYLKTKRENIQRVFTSIQTVKNQSALKENVGLLKNQIHTYELLLFHSLTMITSMVEDDLITFYEIYEAFDKLNVFNSNWENEVSNKLSNIGHRLNGLMRSIDSMERNIISGLKELSYVTEQGFSTLNESVTKELQGIDSSIKFNNLLTGISTYQLYKINKQTQRFID